MPDLFKQPLHLGLGATAVVQPEFTGMDWYADYSARCEVDGAEGRLVSLYTFTEDWTSWECHPVGHEVVVCTAGRMTLHQELADGTTAIGQPAPADGGCAVWPIAHHPAAVQRTR